jgi:catechol 2,3-dioxygenase-like lactoylglutathione lyase family enzyme
MKYHPLYFFYLFLLFSCGTETPETAPVTNVEALPGAVVETPASQESAMLGQASFISIGTNDLAASVQFYKAFGFTTRKRGAAPRAFAQMSDGITMISLWEDGQQYMGLTYFTEDFIGAKKQLDASGALLANESSQDGYPMIVYLTPDSSTSICVIGGMPKDLYQPTGKTLLDMVPSDDNQFPAELTSNFGVFGEFAIPTHDLDASIQFWKKLGFTMSSRSDQQGMVFAILSDGQNIVGVHEAENWDYNALTYFMIDASDALQRLDAAGLNRDEMPAEFGNKHGVYRSPEGQKFNIFSLQ